jgi:hypothetical protein
MPATPPPTPHETVPRTGTEIVTRIGPASARVTATEITGRVTIARVMIAAATTGRGVQTLPGLPNLPATTAIGIATAAATFETVPRIRVMTATGIARWPRVTTGTATHATVPWMRAMTVTGTVPRLRATTVTATGIARWPHATTVTGIVPWPHATIVTGIVTGRLPRATTGTVTATAPRTCATIGTGTEIGMRGIALGIHETRVT